MTKPSKDELIRFDHPCPIRDVLDRIGDQWSLLILQALEHNTKDSIYCTERLVIYRDKCCLVH